MFINGGENDRVTKGRASMPQERAGAAASFRFADLT
jgi:hypothetical protein